MRDNDEALLKERRNHLLKVLKWMSVASRSSQDSEDRLASEDSWVDQVGCKQVIFFSNTYSDWVFNLAKHHWFIICTSEFLLTNTKSSVSTNFIILSCFSVDRVYIWATLRTYSSTGEFQLKTNSFYQPLLWLWRLKNAVMSLHPWSLHWFLSDGLTDFLKLCEPLSHTKRNGCTWPNNVFDIRHCCS